MADQKTIEQRVKEIIVNQLNVNEEQITPTASFLDDLGADSLDPRDRLAALERLRLAMAYDYDPQVVEALCDVLEHTRRPGLSPAHERAA